mmetsp:Transcript_12927/g.19338  ORF Transcript_12927/g.19338 Transcript_12927/m.19338 type:complete len:275 (-) Transcript_12927:73-897(-)
MMMMKQLAILASSITLTTSLIPSSPQQQTRRAIASIKNAISAAKEENRPCRFYLDYLIPLPIETKAEDIDPWPGGLAQMYPYAEDILKEILEGVVDEPAGPCSGQVISEPDCCGFFIQESSVSPKNDVAAILFPGVDQLENIQQINDMVGPSRPLLLFNKQFQRPADFGFFKKQTSQKEIFDTYTYSFAFQEFACRGEDTKLTFEYPNWSSCVICDEDVDVGQKEIKLLDPQSVRPSYEELEAKINEVLPEPLWMRKMGEAGEKGFKFQRGGPK